MYKIKIDLDKILASNIPIILDLGSGNTKKEGRICIDKIDFPNIDIVTDIEDGLPFFPDDSVDEIHANSLFEHIKNFEKLMSEIVRILKKGGRCYVFVPHFSNPYYYSDYTHNRFFGLYTFFYFTDNKHILIRNVPNFYSSVRIKILSLSLIFASPFKSINFLKKILSRVINKNIKFQEFYEENLCHIFPCYGIDVIFTPIK